MNIADTTHTPASEAPTGRLFTIADVECLPKSLPSGDVDYELNNGRLIIVSPPGRKHGKTHMRLGAFLDAAENAGLGEGFIETGVVLWRDPDRLVGTDGAFVLKDRCPVREATEGYLETIPHLAIEIRSKNDSLTELKEKAADYLKAGVAVVWVIEQSCAMRRFIGPITRQPSLPKTAFWQNQQFSASMNSAWRICSGHKRITSRLASGPPPPGPVAQTP